ncbi:hypothetical protein ACUNHX_03335 [Serratia sp. IR-2025]|uniref:hypothetical protein n=1 Tax=Serratia marcescens TaxID=615 RepID=UPI001D15A2C6|nr:hypothetical protein [Serratia marcescens]MCX2172751.1 hypothetical protein [Serratia marcescens]MCX2176022.1 hypothetical protein [Serratia marcescens]WAZ05010.1 hypothetical protein O3T12_17635 [Serratia marcescens]
MTTIKRFTPDYKMHAVRFEAFAREAEHGELVRFDAHQQVVSALEAERDAQQKRADALAVENAGFKHALSVILEHVDVTDKGQAGVVAMIANDELFNSETPDTSAALAAIQAQGVEKLADKLDAEIEQIMRGAFFYDEISSREAISKMVRAFASTLREAK